MGVSNIKNQITFWLSALVPKKDDIWSFGGWVGERYGDNSGAFLEYMAKNHPENNYYWFTNHPNDVINRIPSNVKIVLRNSKEARHILTRSKYKIMCQGAMDFDDCNLIGGAVNIQLWHGVAWKKIGIDCFSKQNTIKGVIKYFSSIWAHSLQHGGSLYVAPSDAYACTLKSAFRIDDKKILMSGFPRNSILFKRSQYSVKKAEILNKLDVDLNKKVVLYMPTFRENGTKRFSFWDYLSRMSAFENIVILEKNHFVDRMTKHISKDNVYDASDFDSQELLLIADLLITDYSSCFFDYLLLDRPIIQFIYDYPYYRDKDRGLYYSDREVDCGYIVDEESALLNLIEQFNFDGLRVTDKQISVKKKFMTYESSDSCERLYREIDRRYRK